MRATCGRCWARVKTEFAKFAEVLARTKAQLESAANSIGAAEVRTRQIERKLKDVAAVPSQQGELIDSNVARLPEA